MKRPENIIGQKNYDKPQSFEKDCDAEIYYSYIEAQKYINYLENEVKKFRLGDGRSEQLKCPTCELSYDKEEIEMFRGVCESCRDRAF